MKNPVIKYKSSAFKYAISENFIGYKTRFVFLDPYLFDSLRLAI